MMLGIVSAPAAFANVIIMADESCRTDVREPDTNNHDSSKLSIRSDEKSAKSWIKFDVSELDIEDVETATLTVALHQEKAGDRHFDVSYVNDDCLDNIGWDERSLTWNNAPGNNTADLGALNTSKTTLLTTVNFTDGVPGDSFSIDVFEALQTDTDGIVQFVCHNSNGLLHLATHDHAEEAWRPFIDASKGAKDKARRPYPVTDATDVPRDVTLGWTPAENADKHDVYFGTDFDAVDSAGAGSPLLVSPAQDANTFEPGRLEFSQTYFWRIDEVNAPPDSTVVRGSVWSFTVEPLAYAIPGENILVTASSYEEGKNPENTVNGSGLVGNLHSIVLEDMWLTAIGEPAPPWIQYDFDTTYKLHEMLVWNYNGPSFLTAAGLKDVVVEYSSDGTAWMQIESVSEFARASGLDDYAPNTTVALDGIPVKSVKITINSNWSGGFADQFGLSEVQFLQIPVNAREPSPDDGATEIAVDVTLGWRAGREAAEHNVSIDADEQAVIDGTALAVTVPEASYGPLSLNLGSTYFWRVDEVNDSDIWQSTVWSFTTKEYAVVDDIESYNDDVEAGTTIFDTWIDGLTNNTGSMVGYWTSPFAEQTIVHGGKQSMPFDYNNVISPWYSEAYRDFSPAQDWSVKGADTLVLYFRGRPLSFLEPSPDEIVMSGSGTDIYGTADQFRFVYKALSGDGAIVARVESLEDTDAWAKGGVMIRASLDPGSRYALVCATPGNGVRFQSRLLNLGDATSDTPVATPEQMALQVPVWVKVERSGDEFNGYYSTDGATWTAMSWNPQTISMVSSAYIGLAVTSHAANVSCTAEFSWITTSGGVSGSWQTAEIGVAQPSNTPAPLYVAVQDSGNHTHVVTHPDESATVTSDWQPWEIPLDELRSGGVDVTKVKRLYIGVGDRTSPQPGGAGLLYIDDIGFGHPVPSEDAAE
jgi:hypothetical protein